MKGITKSLKNIFMLMRLFFVRFFRNESMPFENESVYNMSLILLIACILGMAFTYNLLFHYVFLPENGNSWNEKSQIILIGMLFIGMITILEWNVLFFDKNDYYVLGPLPVKPSLIFFSKLASFLLFVLIFSLSSNILSAFFFPVFLSIYYGSKSVIFFLWFFLVHLIVSFLSNVFVFFFLLTIKGVLTIIFKPSTEKKFSSVLQGLFMLFMVSIYALMPKMYSKLVFLVNNNDRRVFYYPQMWFTGLYESLLGRRTGFYPELSRWAIYSVLIFVFISIFAFLISFLKYMRGLSERGEKVKVKKDSLFKRLFNYLILRSPIERGVFYFMKRTQKRSEKHRVKLYGFIAISVGVIISKYLSEKWLISRGVDIKEWSKIIYSAPFIILIFLVFGLRLISNYPVEPRSNWVFKITEKRDKRVYRRGIHKFIFFSKVLPFTLANFVFYSFLWGIKRGFYFSVYILFVGFLLEEVLFFKDKKDSICMYFSSR